MRQAKQCITPIAQCLLLVAVVSGCAPSAKGPPLQRAAEQMVLKDPQNPEYWVEYGRAALFSNNPQGAEQAFRNALRLNEQYLPAYKHLGLVLVNTGRAQEAESVYERALQLFEQDSESWTAYGYCLLEAGNDTKALEAFRRSTELNTDPTAVISARLGAAALFRRQGDDVQAQAEYEEAVKVNPEIVRLLSEHTGAPHNPTNQP